MTASLPLIDIGDLSGAGSTDREHLARELARACEEFGFFYLTGHAVRPETLRSLEHESRSFFALPHAEKMEIAMARGGRAWRGYFPLGDELTSGRPDQKEGLYLGEELSTDDPRVKAGLPLHGPNLWPARPEGLRAAVETYVAEASRTARLLLELLSTSLGLKPDYFDRTYTHRPTVLFRIFNYPARTGDAPPAADVWGVGEHTDYGLLTLLAQDKIGGLQVRVDSGWLDVPPRADALVCNVGDMLERLTRGRFRSVPHRVEASDRDARLSFPLFFDPDFLAPMAPLPGPAVETARLASDRADRWDHASVHQFDGVYGDYLLSKVGKVFPDLQRALDDRTDT